MTIHQLKPLNTPSLADQVEQFRLLDREFKALKEKHKALQKQITDTLGDQTEVKNYLGHTIATYIFVNGSKFNRKAFDIANPGFYDEFEALCKQYNEPTQIRRFQLK